MTFYHFINCLLLTFAPPIMLYKFSSLSEYGTIWRTGMGVLAYVVTQVCKLLIIAVVMTPNAMMSHLIDCLGMYWFLINQNKASVASVKILSIALGWSVAESIFTRLVDFYLNARSLEFEWIHLISAAEANIVLLQNMCVSALLWQWNRSGNKLSVVLMMVYFVSLSLIKMHLLSQIGALIALSTMTLFLTN
ncbi:BOS complex subunit TMEM147-like [Oppia nitens]|uniref:BOS complex subunit TMEM147-like n=1 Tax=Oppia nitens TaxID=1686743 RepID=UPI0023DC2F58|nr:BOS complex subunit TMEM147-like [Oppia nitens]